MYYKDSEPAKGLIILGKIDGGLETLTSAGAGTMTIELVQPSPPITNKKTNTQ